MPLCAKADCLRQARHADEALGAIHVETHGYHKERILLVTSALPHEYSVYKLVKVRQIQKKAGCKLRLAAITGGCFTEEGLMEH